MSRLARTLHWTSEGEYVRICATPKGNRESKTKKSKNSKIPRTQKSKKPKDTKTT